MTGPVLTAEHVGKQYRLYESARDRFLALLGWADRARTHWALKDVSFTLQRGQCLGVVGDNGAGKSTLLKLLAGTLQPSSGHLHRVGRLTAILELGAGFHPDFTGRENLVYGGSLIGLSPADMQELAGQIIEFSELGDAIDRPVKTYSSGMVVRLAFALVTAVQPEVLIIDEALAVGDQHFQKKCVQRLEEFRQNGCTVLFCSHSLYHVRQLCDRVLWLDKGLVRGLGPTEAVLSQYENHVRVQDAQQNDPDEQLPAAGALPGLEQGKRAGLFAAQVKGLIPPDQGQQFAHMSEPDLDITIQAVVAGEEVPSMGMMLERFQGDGYPGVGITSLATHAEGVQPKAIETKDGNTVWQAVLTFPDLPLHSGQYALSFYLLDAKGLVVYDEWRDYIVFQWISPILTPGLVRLPHQWS